MRCGRWPRSPPRSGSFWAVVSCIALLVMSLHVVSAVLAGGGETASSYSQISRLPSKMPGADTDFSSEKPIPWVFTFRDDADDAQIDMMKGAVLSFLKYGKGSLIPFCMYHGSETTHAYEWMRDHGVAMIKHTPSWGSKFWHDVETWMSRGEWSAQMAVWVRGGKKAILGTFLRIDIPILDELKDFEYILYTDYDIYFRGPVRIMCDVGFYPKTIAMARPSNPDPVHVNNWNAGVLLMNATALRETYDDFLATLFDRNGNLDYLGFGPNDQGLYNSYFADSKMRLPDGYNYRPSRVFRFSSSAAKDTVIIHFPGSHKPPDWFRGTHMINPGKISERSQSMCQFLVLDRYFELLGKEVQQAQLDMLSLCQSSSSTGRSTGRLRLRLSSRVG